VQTVENWMIAPLRKRQFFSIEEINDALKNGLEELNTRPMQHFEKSRRVSISPNSGQVIKVHFDLP